MPFAVHWNPRGAKIALFAKISLKRH